MRTRIEGRWNEIQRKTAINSKKWEQWNGKYIQTNIHKYTRMSSESVRNGGDIINCHLYCCYRLVARVLSIHNKRAFNWIEIVKHSSATTTGWPPLVSGMPWIHRRIFLCASFIYCLFFFFFIIFINFT